MRNILLRGLAGLVAAMAVALGGAAGERTLYIYTWEEYFAPEVIAAFEKAENCRVDFTYYDSNDVMYQTILEDSSGYDLITPPVNIAAALRRRGLLLPLDHGRLANLAELTPGSPLLATDPEFEYLVPYTGIVTGVGYNRAKVLPDQLGSWEIFENPALAGKVAMLNDLRETIGAALKYLGFSANTTTPMELLTAANVLKRWKNHVAMFDVDNAKRLLAEGRLAAIQGYNGDIAALIMTNPDIGFYIPAEGSTMNGDYFAVPVGAESPDLAHAFINHMLKPDMARANMEYSGYYMPNRRGLENLSEALRNNPAFNLSADAVGRCEMIKLLDAGHDLYDEVWGAVLLD